MRYEELYNLALALRFSRSKFLLPGRPLSSGELLERFTRELSFSLTTDQQDTVGVLLSECAAPRRMHRLLQGDVGSGKTVVAFCAALPSLNEGLQVAWMTPTELLARQTWVKIREWLRPLGFTAELLTSTSGSATENREVRRRMASGETRFIIGTHSLLQPSVNFREVGIFIIDEQHRFGAQQRLLLHEKDRKADFLMLSATPIPQTLARTLYGDLDILTIRTLLPDRRPVRTCLVPEEKRHDMEKFIGSQAASGFQCYYIVPRIERDDADQENTQSLHDLSTTFSELTKSSFCGLRTSFVHGRVAPEEKNRALDDFSNGLIDLLVATSVVEVGIDVPAATVIVIENAEMFGLAQLHQLRGRVGRGREQSYCFLPFSSSLDERTRERLRAFCLQTDGFAIAEMDLRLRGPGEVTGYKQSGWDDLVFADILRDADLFNGIRNEIEQFFSKYPAK